MAMELVVGGVEDAQHHFRKAERLLDQVARTDDKTQYNTENHHTDRLLVRAQAHTRLAELALKIGAASGGPEES